MNFSSTEVAREAMSRIRELSADEETRRLAFVRERALRDEVSLLNDARREAEQLRAEKTARNLIKLGVLSDEQIAEATDLPLADLRALRVEDKH